MISARTKSLAWRLGSIAFFCGLPLLLLVLVGSNLMQAADANDLAARQKATLTQIVTKLATRRSRDLTSEDKASLYLASPTPSLARAEIQARASKLVDAAGGHFAEAQVTGTPEQEADGTVAIQLALDIDNKGLLDLLYALEAGLPLLDVTDLSARTTNGQTDEQPIEHALMHVEMTVQGHFRKNAG